MTDESFAEQDRQRLLENYEIFEKNSRGESTQKVNCGRLAKLLLEADGRYYLITKDNQELFSYNGSYYEPCGEAIIRERVQTYLGDVHGLNYIKNEVVGYIKNNGYVDRELLNPPLHLINVKNGFYDLKEGKLLPHSPKHFFLNEIPVNYNPDAKQEKILGFLMDTLNVEDIRIVQEFFGDCLLRSYPYKKAMMILGETDTGKSQLLSLLGRFLGEKNTSNVSLFDLCHDRFATVDLYGKLANICADIGANNLRTTELFLMCTGGDRIGAQRKFQQRYSFRNTAKLIFSCNRIPDSENKNDAYYNRWLVIECTNQLPKEEQIKNYFEVLVTEENLSWLFNWSVEGLKRLQEQDGYSEHRSLEDVRRFMEQGQNPIRDFVDQYIIVDGEGEIIKDVLYQCYRSFCKERGYPTKVSNVFSRKFKDELPFGANVEEGQPRKGGHKTVWRGIVCTYVPTELSKEVTDNQQETLEC